MIILSERISEKNIISAQKIYNHYILNSFSNFEEKIKSVTAFKKLYRNIKSNKLPFIIGLKDREVVGLAFVNKFRDKSGYRFTFEHSIYIKHEYKSKGYGSIILKNLIKLSKKNKEIKNLIAVIGGSDNIASINIHKKNGFELIGTLKKVGFKKNKWIDSVYMQKKI